ncbi:Hypothetical protein, putative [Bodo saltans]|uniref:DUF4833 domain-containing protein n=1 Tax=Bodo saltans TaxID=75058 RepID=A0A0S4JNM1_BODSA|nr:Hypothetical protein, putative [Bodo saltans]|eukprot:CUG90987.1 Hypothetical protein, putative [Bodo saltans]
MAALEISVPELVANYGASGLFEKIAAHIPAERGSRFSGDIYNIALYIQRSKNENVVCYAADFEDAAAGVLKPSAPIDAYWLDIDPEYVTATREKGQLHDRCELNLIDRTMAYGHSASEPKDASGVTYYDVKFVAISRKMQYLAIRGGINGNTFTPVFVSVIGGQASVATRIYVKSTEPKHFWNLPSVEYVELFGVSIATGEATYEKITSA